MITRDNLKILRDELTEAINNALTNTKSGLNLTFDGIGNISFNENKFSFKVNINDTTNMETDLTNNKGIAIPPEFVRDAKTLGIPAETYGSEVTIGGTAYKLIGLNLKAHKYPFIAIKRGTTTKFKLPVEYKDMFIKNANN